MQMPDSHVVIVVQIVCRLKDWTDEAVLTPWLIPVLGRSFVHLKKAVISEHSSVVECFAAYCCVQCFRIRDAVVDEE
jgi:hypothetical protein